MKANFLTATGTMSMISVLLGCSSQSDRTSDDGVEMKLSDEHPEGRLSTTKMQLTSSAFGHKEKMPKKYTADGENVSPPLTWAEVPEGTKQFALICDDPDAPSAKNPRPAGPWVHWVLFKIPADATELPEAIPAKHQHNGMMQATNESGSVGYSGPAPPNGSGPHRYFFKLYALDTEVDIDPNLEGRAAKSALLEAIKGHVLAESQLVGGYER